MYTPLPYQDHVLYGEYCITYQVVFSERKTLGIQVHPDSQVEIRAPHSTSRDIIKERVKNRSSWILKQLRFFESVPDPLTPKEYVGGETHYYLGRQYRLKIRPIHEKKEACVKLIGRYLNVYTKQPDDQSVTEKLLQAWFREKALLRLEERFNTGWLRMRKYGLSKPELQIRAMKNRWGSYTASGRVLLNTELIHVPTACIDYVVIHELCHIKHPHHGTSFYAFLSRVMPEWRQLKERLGKVRL